MHGGDGAAVGLDGDVESKLPEEPLLQDAASPTWPGVVGWQASRGGTNMRQLLRQMHPRKVVNPATDLAQTYYDEDTGKSYHSKIKYVHL